MIISSNYFNKWDLYIPNNKNIDVQPKGAPSIKSELDEFIIKYERKFLLNALGVQNYNNLIAAELDLNNVSNLKWKNLIKGEDYTVGTEMYRWNGLNGVDKCSVIACYVFCNHFRVNEETYSTVGMVRNVAKNAILENPIAKFVRVWNEFLEMYQGGVEHADNNYYNSSFNGISGFYSQNTEREPESSLYQYLCDKNTEDETNFPNLKFKFYKPHNRYGI